ncbi:MAG: endolytic transglycosylase MltG, partial [Candidatus Latescibacteria bacterium]|nr:endolytic transglycosylase MltG [Candidatus Latescibacterota bacterium]
MKGIRRVTSGEVRPGDEARRPGGGRRFLFVLLGTVAVMGAVVGMMGAIYALNRPTGVRPREVTIKKGMSVAEIAGQLHREGVIRSPRLLRAFSVLNGTSRRLTAGVHRFHGRMTAWQVLLELEVPRDVTRDVTIPEGMRREHVARVLAES